MIKLFKFEGYRLTISEEAFTLKPFKRIWQRDRSESKEKALSELGFIYFFCDPRSDYQYLIDEQEREKAIKEGEGMPSNWKPDKLIEEAIEFYQSFKPTASLLLEDTRYMVNKLRERIRNLDFDTLDIKEFKEVTSIIKQITPLIKELDSTEKALNAEMREEGKMRGSGEKTIFEDDINI